ncbi:hypothetical protein V9T40_005670 [Parthenolecanium corni]|uniref:Uncharacterized protein n=1 Tax=Parthenolecanium corni TaxID=536013 RepID=A0AAN9U2A7_9HEMI
MSEFNFNIKGPSESVFKVPTLPSRYRKTCNNTQSTYNNESTENTYNVFKKVEERFEVLKKICPPEDVTKILNETVDRLTAACYEKMADQLLRPGNSQAYSSGGSSVYSVNTRQSVLVPSVSNYGTLIPNVQVPDRPSNSTSDQLPRTISHVEREEPAAGLFIPIRSGKPNPPASQSKRTSKKQSSEIKELEVLPSEDESDSLSVFFGKGKGRNTTKQSTTVRPKQSDRSKKPAKSHDLSVTLQRIEVSNENESAIDSSRKRKASQNDEVPSRKKSPVVVEKELRPSPDTTTSNIVARKPAKPASDDTLRRSNRNISVLSTKKQESAAKSKENKENREKPRTTTVKPKENKNTKPKNQKAKAAPVVEKGMQSDLTRHYSYESMILVTDAESNTNEEQEVFDDGSFFGDVSSIVGADSLVLTNTIAKNITKHSAGNSGNRTDMQTHFFSPFANIRSTSGVSAISTPLSKTLTKHVLGKRLKKPNVVAELKNAQARKPKKANLKAADVVPIPENVSESSESDPEVSDFSD